MKILAIEPYYAGSHKAFIDGWMARSNYDWDLLTLPGFKWKWRMRGGAVTMAGQAGKLFGNKKRPEGACYKWDVIFCSDMLNLAEFVGLCDNSPAGLKQAVSPAAKIVYFHENQLTYPVRFESERDYQFAFTNMTTALAADEVWFNSGFHRGEFLDALGGFLKRMPDYQPVEAVEQIRAKSKVVYPAVDVGQGKADGLGNTGDYLHIVWAARWEHDKRPEDFFGAVDRLIKKGLGDKIKVSVIGESFRDSPDCFKAARQRLDNVILSWGWQDSRADYLDVLKNTDVIVSTAGHEFFGMAVVEAVSCGAMPVLPDRLAYPEIFAGAPDSKKIFYDGSVDGLVDKLAGLIKIKQTAGTVSEPALAEAMKKYQWRYTAEKLDSELEKTVKENKDQ
jgi:glycosyltransferase involved in cell wall biosynthesis